MTAAALLARIDLIRSMAEHGATPFSQAAARDLAADGALRALRVAVEALDRTDSPRTRPNLSSDALAEIARLLEVAP